MLLEFPPICAAVPLVMIIFPAVIAYLTGQYAFSSQLQAFWMAFQGAIKVRLGPNKNRDMAWFHALMLTTVSAFAGGCFAPILMGRPTPMLSSDLCLAMSVVAFIIVNYMPFDLGFKVGRTLPVTLVTTTFAQLFRSIGIVRFTDIAYDAFKDSPSHYYPTPVLGPIMFATMLGNMGGFFAKGFHGHLENGMPWPFQNGFFCASFYHFIVHDKDGFIGITLRKAVNAVPIIKMGLDDKTFAITFVGAFMQITGILQLPAFLGPSFSPFTVIQKCVGALIRKVPKAEVDYTVNGVDKCSNTGKKRHNKKASSSQEKDKKL